MKKQEAVTFNLPAHLDYLPIAASAARHCAILRGFSTEEAGRISLALVEAATNAIELGFNADTDRLRIGLAPTALGLKLRVRSRGIPLETMELPQYDPDKAEDQLDITGLGLLLINSMMDHVSHSILESNEREVAMVKHLPSVPVQDDIDQLLPDNGPSTDLSDSGCEVRAAVADDADSIARLALRSHGDILFSEHIYYPERVRAMIESGEMTSIVAVSGEGALMGHGALVPHSAEAQVEELTYAFVDSRFRAQGCLGKIAAALLADARQRRLKALSAFAVTNHVNSQRALLRMHFSESGLLLATSSPSQAWRKDAKGNPQRIANLLFHRYLREGYGKPLHLPARHAAMIRRIQGNREINAPLAELVAPAPLPPRSFLTTEAEIKEGWGAIFILSYGEDLVQQVAEQVERMRALGLFAIQLLLPLEDPATPTQCVELEAMGFFFCGIGPDDEGNEQLLLQTIHGVDPDYDSIHVHTDFANEIKAYVRSCDPSQAG